MLNEPVKSQGKNHQIKTQNNLNAKATSTDIMQKERVGGQEKGFTRRSKSFVARCLSHLYPRAEM